MEFAVYFTALFSILIGMVGLGFAVRLRALGAAEKARAAHSVDLSRYAPMQRLLSSNDLELVSSDPQLARTLRNHRYRVFRGYLRCLTKDFGALLGGVREMIVASGTDRPELAVLLVKSKWTFAIALFRIETSLWFYRYGIKTVDVSGLVEQAQNLVAQAQMPSLAASAA